MASKSEEASVALNGKQVDWCEPTAFLSRWAIVKRMPESWLRRLHEVESEIHAEKLRMRLEAGYKTCSTEWQYEYGLARANDLLGKFWDKKITSEERAAANRLFQKHIRGLWVKFWGRYCKGEMTEIEAVHAADLAIQADPYVYPKKSGQTTRLDELKSGLQDPETRDAVQEQLPKGDQ